MEIEDHTIHVLDVPTDEEFCELINTYRLEHGLSWAKIGAILGVSAKAAWCYGHGRVRPYDRTKVKLLARLRSCSDVAASQSDLKAEYGTHPDNQA
jgi:hypothetical protein